MTEKLQGSLFYIILAAITIALFILVLNFIGFPVSKTVQDWGKSLVPGLSRTETTKTTEADYWKKKYLISQKDIKEKDQKIVALQKQVLSGEKQLLDYKINNQDLKSQLNAKVSEQYQNQLNQIANIYGNMPETKAAAIIEALPLEDASLTVSMLDPDTQSSVLSSMKNPEKAAQITLMLKDIATVNEKDYTALKQQIHELALNQENPTERLAEAMNEMPAVQSAGIIQSLMATNSTFAINVFKQISTTTSSQILAQLHKNNAKLAAQLVSNLNN